MKKYMVTFKGLEVGVLTTTEKGYSYNPNKENIAKLAEYPIFDLLKNPIEESEIPFFKVRIERGVDGFETDDYKIIPIE